MANLVKLGMCAVGALSFMSGTMSGALAQTASDTPASAGAELEEIIVTAQKREQALNDVGMSISAFTGDALNDLGVTSTADLTRVVAGLSVTPPNTGIAGAPVYTLRGVGFNENSLSALSAVSFYVDEVPLPYVFMTAGPWVDVQRVEVLKGPQGTLYGQNSTGGAINYIANRPTDSFEAGVEGSFGSFERIDVNGYLSGPLTDTLQARLAVRSITADGWQESRSRDDELGAVEQWSGRLLLDWTPLESLRFQFNLNGWQDRSESTAAQVVGWNPAVPTVVFNSFYPLYDEVVNDAEVNPDDARSADWTTGYDYDNHNNFTQQSIRADWDLSDSVTLTSITAQSDYDTESLHDTDASPIDSTAYLYTGTIDSFSQELRLSGAALDRLNWIVGANYSKDEIHADIPSFTTQSTVAILGGLRGSEPVSDSERKSRAVFASADYELTSSVTLTGGVRYTEVDLDYAGCTLAFGDLLGPAGECFTIITSTFTPGVVRVALEEDNISWRGGVNWKPDDDLLLYGNVSRGFKSGDFPTLVAFFDTQLQPVVQEKLTAYEIGFKSTLFDRALQVNGAIFHYDYKDKQLYGFISIPIVGVGESTVNIPESTVDGAELEVVWRPLEGLTLRSAVGYTDSEIGDDTPLQIAGLTSPVPPTADFVSQSLVDVSGDPFNLAPEWQANFDGEYEWSLSSSLMAFVGASLVYSDSTLPTIGASRAAELEDYTTVDLRAGVEAADGRYRASVWGRNVTDEVYAVAISRSFDTTTRFTGMPATYGITLAYRFQ